MCFVLQLEKAKKKEAAFIVTLAKREQEIAELKASFAFLDMCVCVASNMKYV